MKNINADQLLDLPQEELFAATQEKALVKHTYLYQKLKFYYFFQKKPKIYWVKAKV